MTRLLGIACLLLLACGCAPQAYTRADLDGKVVCDRDRMDAIERHARRNNTEIHWVSCPTVTLRVVG